jgi:NAD(P)-dependent dehydrogenase (short-subunit alcohol dehydrogenase family)
VSLQRYYVEEYLCERCRAEPLIEMHHRNKVVRRLPGIEGRARAVQVRARLGARAGRREGQCPGAGLIATAITEPTHADSKRLEACLPHVPMKRVGEPEELAGPVVFLCTDAASYITGAILPVNGGYLGI